ncbi:MAG TPA: hypothetical protein VGH69_20095 [Mycobacterium sp.]
MPTTPAPGETIVPSVDQQFLDIICSDADLLEAEFDAIIAAEWPSRPEDRGGRGEAPREASRSLSRAAARDPGPLLRSRHSSIDRWARQRSPP